MIDFWQLWSGHGRGEVTCDRVRVLCTSLALPMCNLDSLTIRFI